MGGDRGSAKLTEGRGKKGMTSARNVGKRNNKEEEDRGQGRERMKAMGREEKGNMENGRKDRRQGWAKRH
jgi:hypothetical protein